MRRNRIVGTALAGLLLVGTAAVVGWQGLQTCGWIDRMLGRSGCIGTVSFDGVRLSRHSVAQPVGAGRVVMAVDMRTADGWRPGLIVFDPATGAEYGRYPLPMRGGNLRLFQSADRARLLIACGVIERFCTELGGDAVVTDSGDLRNFEDFPVEDRYLTAYPGTPRPGSQHGPEAVFARQGSRILAGGSLRPVVLLDGEGTLLAELDRQSMPAFAAAVSVTGIIARKASGDSEEAGDRVRFWDARDGAELGRITGSAGWRLRAPPFWSDDGATLFVPREQNGAMLLDRFRVP